MIDHGYQTRTWDELKAETLARAERGAYPVFAIKPDDARDALSMIRDLDPDAWGGAWMAVGDRFMEQAQKAEASDASAAAQHYLYAWRLYTLGRWPVMSAPNKRAELRQGAGGVRRLWPAGDADHRAAVDSVRRQDDQGLAAEARGRRAAAGHDQYRRQRSVEGFGRDPDARLSCSTASPPSPSTSPAPPTRRCRRGRAPSA